MEILLAERVSSRLDGTLFEANRQKGLRVNSVNTNIIIEREFQESLGYVWAVRVNFV
jgi:hypothetical protein